MLEAEETRKRSFKRIHQLQQHAAAKRSFAGADPLSMQQVVLLRDRVDDTRQLAPGEIVDAYLGIDIGSVCTNLVAIDEAGNVMHEIYLRTPGRPIEVVHQGLAEIASRAGAAASDPRRGHHRLRAAN